ncbi:E3 ubiquitin-protein ligase Os04g0590900-like [Oryza brachyantha]|uniref:E3 ubiquitin-protein ligase Os04g0590900-like n=1 Tax=Oryza brachyantha TaxID=4533 RepID=UPI001ADCFE7B|nr:E3 ubiquitin-protein ligase Os04g0590900-like [Oryza brachyantha]
MARRCLVTSDPASASPPPAVGADDAATQAPQSRLDLHRGLGMKVAVAGNVVAAVLIFAVIIWRLFFFGGGNDGGGGAAAAGAADDADGASSSGESSPCASPQAGCGLREEDLMALPVYVHGASAEDGAGAAAACARKAAECAVCIGELRDGDACRLLPRCGHRFHAECVDRWFRSHATCPLCRAAVADGDDSGEADPKVVLDA